MYLSAFLTDKLINERISKAEEENTKNLDTEKTTNVKIE